MRSLFAGFCVCLFGVCAFAAPIAHEADELDYSYAINRRDVEKKPGSLKDHTTDGVSWHTKFVATTDIVCEFQESCDVARVEIQAYKWTKWFVLKELKIFVDNGVGDFGDPTVIPGYGYGGDNAPFKDASCSNHVYTAANLGRAVRVKVQVVSDAAVGIGEIRFFGKPAVRPVAKTPAATEARRTGDFKKLENRFWKLEVNPLGGRLQSVYSKAIDTELTNPAGDGSFTEEVWNRRASHEFLIKKPFALTYGNGPAGTITATAVGNAQGGGIDFLKVVKRYSASEESTALKVDYRFENLPEAMALQNYAPLIHTTLGVFRRDVNCFYPTTDGIRVSRIGQRPNEYWGHHPARGWMAAATDEGTGVVVTMPFRDVKMFYSWFSQVPTLEWRMTSVALKEGEGYDVATEVIPFKGLPIVSGAGGGFVGMLDGGVCRIVSARAGKIVVEECETAKNAKGAKNESRSERVMAFKTPGETQEFRTVATTVVLRRDGKEVCRLEAKPKDGAWTLERECASRESSVAEIDLTSYTNFTASVCFPWAKPFAGGKLKVAVLTGPGGVVEFGRLADRLDMEYHIMGVGVDGFEPGKHKLANPIYSNGDHFGLVNVADVERGIEKVLDFNADVILVGGIPYEAFPQKLGAKLVEKVKGGTGLVWIGGKSYPPPVKGVKVQWLKYNALGGWPQNAPGLTPSEFTDFYEDHAAPVEEVYSKIAKALLEMGGRKLPVAFTAAEVKSDTAKFAVTSDVAGPTVWSWRVVDPFGAVIKAGERQATLVKGAQEVALEQLDIPQVAGELGFDVCVRSKGSSRSAASRETGRRGAAPPLCGDVLSWGEWKFRNPPKAEIVSLTVDNRWHEEGDVVKFEVGVKGDCAGMMLKLLLVDSHGRLLAEKQVAAAEKVAESFRLENELVARCYTIEARITPDPVLIRRLSPAYCSRRRVEVRCRPADAKMAWNDFEVGIWGNASAREYLWPDLAALYRGVGIKTVIANPRRAQEDFPMRHNLNPTLLTGAGLERSPEPQAYTKTGDKTKLVRGTCLSSPKFFADRDRSLARLCGEIRRPGYRFVWFGDEQSITGYGGVPVDFCFSEHCLREMRTFVRAKYGTLEKLNAEWETSFASWDEVVPFTRQEVWAANGRHVAGWADHLEFMDSRLTNSIAYSVRALRQVDPSVRFALSGTQEPSAYGGMDWWKEMNVMDALLNYGGGGQFDIQRSFNPAAGLMPWNWGYAQKGAGAIDSVWAAAFVGSRGIMGFHASSQFNCDWSYSQGLRDTVPHVRRLADGVGMHFVNNLRTRPDVAILYSQASFRAAFIENRREENDKLAEKIRRLLQNLGQSYDYVSYDELAAGAVAKRGYRALILADAVAMGDAECVAVKAFAQAGGLVIAEGVPATRRQNCVKRPSSPLMELFVGGDVQTRTTPEVSSPRAVSALGDDTSGVVRARHVLFEKIDVRYLKAAEYPEKAENRPIVLAEQAKYAAALARAGVTNEKLGIIDAETGNPVLNAEVRPKFDAKGNPTWCVMARAIATPRDVRFVFPKTGFVFDLVSGRAYGKVKELTLPLGKGVPYAFAQYVEENPAIGVVHVRVYRPDGTEADCYAKNVLVRDGTWDFRIPFALSDQQGTWRIVAESIFGRGTVERKVGHLSL